MDKACDWQKLEFLCGCRQFNIILRGHQREALLNSQHRLAFTTLKVIQIVTYQDISFQNY